MILTQADGGVDRAVEGIRNGKLVGLPTETVYGIGCDALNPSAIKSVFALKGRPPENPLIVHLASWDWIDRVCSDVPPIAKRLATLFWPGPLTLVLPKRPEVPDLVTAGLPTVAVRVPRHPLTLQVIEGAGTPVAAPSANRFMGLSASQAEDIDPAIEAGLELILDGGPCEVGIESTVVDLTRNPFRLLRPGGVSRGQLEAVCGRLEVDDAAEGAKPSPGMYSRHYAPKAEVRLVERISGGAAGLVLGATAGSNQVAMPPQAAEYARALYHALHELDASGAQVIEVEAPPAEWEAVWDRLRKASSPG